MRSGRTLTATGAVIAIAMTGLFAAPGTSGGLSATVSTAAEAARAAFTPWYTCASEIERPVASLVAAYPLDDATGSTSARDASGNGRDAEVSGAIASVTDGPIACPRDPGGAWAPDGSTTLRAAVAFPANSSIEVWLKTSDSGEFVLNGAMRRLPRRRISWALATDREGGLVVAVAGQVLLRTDDLTVADGRWHHVAIVVADDGTSLLVDGTVVAASEDVLPSLPVTLTVAGGDAGAMPEELQDLGAFRGELRSLFIWSAALDPATVRQQFAAGRPAR